MKINSNLNFPDPMKGAGGIWGWLYDAIAETPVNGTFNVKLPNKKDADLGSVSASHPRGKASGMRCLTRVRPVDKKDGEYYLFIKRIE
jgi:hypothetical protein